MSLPSSSADRSGVVYNANDGRAMWLPLEALDVHTFIVDLTARVVLSQNYSYSAAQPLREAYYVFPIPARAAVCSFEVVTSSGVRLEGKVKEIAQAKQEYEEALQENKLAALLEQFRHDIFALSIGSIPAKTNISVTITYVTDLEDDDIDNSVRFQLSSVVRGRYGAPSTSVLYEIPGTTHQARLCITVDIQMSSHILSVTSPRHLLQDITLATPSPQRCRKKFESNNVGLDDDFVLVIQAMDLDQPRCLAEVIRYSDGKSTALALTIVPNFHQSAMSPREFLFLIDRSGSMSGSRIQMAKSALQALLRCLPNGSTFNICSFGSTYEFWNDYGSQVYGPNTVTNASQYVNYMEANLGGTEIESALGELMLRRNMSMPTSIFVLTDGEVYNGSSNPVVSLMEGAVRETSSWAPLRICTLAVGSGASTDFCEALAQAGGGICLSTTDGENLTKKTIRLFEAMESPDVGDLSVSWSVPGTVQVLQSPATFKIFPNKRLLITAILPLNQPPPPRVVLHGRLINDSPLDYEVQVQRFSPVQAHIVEEVIGHPIRLPPLIHTLAAHRHIVDIERGFFNPCGGGNTSNPETQTQAIRKTITELGIRYQIASSCTAFIAMWSRLPASRSNKTRTQVSSVSGSLHTAPTNMNSRPNDHPNTSRQSSGGYHGTSNSSTKSFQTAPDSTNDLDREKKSNGGGQQPPTTSSASTSTSSTSTSSTPIPPGGFSHSFAPSSTNKPMLLAHQAQPSHIPELLYFFNGKLPPMILTAPALIQDTVILPIWRSIRSFIFRKPQTHVTTNQAYSLGHAPVPPTSPDDPAFHHALDTLTRLQESSGLYTDIGALIRELSISLPLDNQNPPVQAQQFIGYENAIWATAIAVAYLMKKFPSQWSTWGRFGRKMREAGAHACGDNEAVFTEIVQCALKVL